MLFILSGQSCDVTYTNRTGFLTSENYPNRYPGRSDCSNIISVQGATAFQIQFVAFETQEDVDILYYGVGSLPRENRALGSFNGSVIPDDFKIESDTIWFLFKSDFSVSLTGFNLTWTAVLDTEGTLCLYHHYGVCTFSPANSHTKISHHTLLCTDMFCKKS